MVIDHGAVPMFVQLLSSGSDDVREQVIFFPFLAMSLVCLNALRFMEMQHLNSYIKNGFFLFYIYNLSRF